MKRLPVIRYIGALVLVLSLWGVVYSAKATVSHIIYNEVRYKDERESRLDPEKAEQLAQAAFRLYPYNYYFCIWTAENCWYYRLSEEGNEKPERVILAQKWCDRGLALNNRKSQLKLLKARLIARRSPADGAEYWSQYVDWHFWDSYNHAALVELYAGAGDMLRAMEELEWVRGSKHYNYASGELQAAWKREMTALPEESR